MRTCYVLRISHHASKLLQSRDRIELRADRHVVEIGGPVSSGGPEDPDLVLERIFEGANLSFVDRRVGGQQRLAVALIRRLDGVAQLVSPANAIVNRLERLL